MVVDEAANATLPASPTAFVGHSRVLHHGPVWDWTPHCRVPRVEGEEVVVVVVVLPPQLTPQWMPMAEHKSLVSRGVTLIAGRQKTSQLHYGRATGNFCCPACL